ncbi:MAG TPA: gamma-glutamyl-gamma-aminobutyrate hydrolase family protein [Thermodesulfovibrionales bacterium]|jgi:putative glutamine amidotransferase|nr:gamma-glutamyl-gamma-aminobutyrate hydrolase family protein [Thermodesulfovibrionales bacterium]
MGGKYRPIIGITLDREEEFFRSKRHYAERIERAGGLPLLIPDGNDPASVAERVDGLLIPGGGDIDPSYFGEEPHPSVKIVPRERTDFEIALLRAIMMKGKPVLGICYGMQLINVALGGDLYQDLESQFKAAIDHRKGFHRVVGRIFFLEEGFMVATSHHQGVRKLGKGLDVCAFSEDHLVEALCFPGYPFLLGVQWHPERSDDDASLNLLRSFVESAHAGK